MSRPDYLPKYAFNWELFDVIMSGKSGLDAHSFLAPISKSRDEVYSFLNGYGFDQSDTVLKAELFGNFQESIQFIKRYFLKEGNPEGLDLEVPNILYSVLEVSDLFLMTMGKYPGVTQEESLWAGIILKVMHTILHADKDLRYNYFATIQQQVFDRFYKYLIRDELDRLYLGTNEDYSILLYDFDIKAKKSRDSIIMKLLHKPENVAEELFDRIGVRLVTHTKIDALRVVKFLQEYNIVVAHNIKPSRSRNSLVDLVGLKKSSKDLMKMAMRNNLTEDRFVQALEREAKESWSQSESDTDINKHSHEYYRSIQFTCRQLIKYKNPFIQEFKNIREMAKNEDSPLAHRILSLDISRVAREVRFFYPFEVQIVDVENHKKNTMGESSHQEYKKSQTQFAMSRLFRPLVEYKKLNTDLAD